MDLNDIIQPYFHQPSLASVGIHELQKAKTKHPYCALLQFLLLKKQQQDHDPDFAEQLKTSQLYFTNPYWLQVLIHQQEVKTKRDWQAKPVITGQFHYSPDTVFKEPTVSAPPVAHQEEEQESLSEELSSRQGPPEEEDSILSSRIQQQLSNAAASFTQPGEETGKAGSVTGIEQAGSRIESQVEHPAETGDSRAEILLKESPIPIPSLKDISPRADEQPIFEPYHTIDYFASLGIKLSNELPANDRLGRQLRSFTDWIRTMKKLPQTDLEQQMGEPGVGDKIAAMAAGSVVRREILTETMAEVLIKQGNLEKALELYHKLSLAYPDKSVYFAARIDQLKRS